MAKLHMLFNYFELVTQTTPTGVVTFQRKYTKQKKGIYDEAWASSKNKLIPTISTDMEDVNSYDGPQVCVESNVTLPIVAFH